MNEENRLIIEQLNKFGRVPHTSELLKMIEDLEKERNMYKTSFEEMSKNYFEVQNNWNELKKWLLDGTKEDNWVQGDMFWKEACKSVINKMQELEKKDDR